MKRLAIGRSCFQDKEWLGRRGWSVLRRPPAGQRIMRLRHAGVQVSDAVGHPPEHGRFADTTWSIH